MTAPGFDTRIKIQEIIENQLPEFILDENPKVSEFLKQYYISQEYQGGSYDIVENLDQYLKLDYLIPEIIDGSYTLTDNVSISDTTIFVSSTKGFPDKYGLLKIDNEIITYTEKDDDRFIGCVRGFSGVTNYQNNLNIEELVFSTSVAASHTANSSVENLSSLFLKEFYKKIKFLLTPGLEDVDFVPELNVGNFIKEIKSFYQSKGTPESFRILFNVLYGTDPKIIDLEKFLIKPSSATYIRRENVISERVSGDPTRLVGQTIVKNSDPTSFASVSSAEIFSRSGKTYYKLSLFVGFDLTSKVEGNFTIIPKTKVLDSIEVGSEVITVDSTIGFDKSGTLICGNNVIQYTDKSINQFFGCSGITEEIEIASDIATNDYYYGYEDGDTTKKVEIRIDGILSDFVPTDDIYLYKENEEIFVKNLGKIIDNPSENKNYTHIFANSWVYNTKTRYEVLNSDFVLSSPIDKSSLKPGDKVDILIKGSQTIVSNESNPPIVAANGINYETNQVSLDNLGSFSYDQTKKYEIRRRVNKASSSTVPINYGNNVLVSDIQNLYDGNDGYYYVASNSLPSYNITKTLVEKSIPEASGTPDNLGYIQGYSQDTGKYSIISFDTPVEFITGDRVYYQPENASISGLDEGFYFVEVVEPNKIRLYFSNSFILGSKYIEFQPLNDSPGSHNFILEPQKSRLVSSQKLLRKFPNQPPKPAELNNEILQNSSVGMLVNGVEVKNYKSTSKVYYGPVDSVSILSGGSEYDVINPPKIELSSPTQTGTTALVNPALVGSLKEVSIVPTEINPNYNVQISITGGNGSGASVQPTIENRYRYISFDARRKTNFGGVDTALDTITFLDDHELRTGDQIIYDSNGNAELGINPFGSPDNVITNLTLNNRTSYYSKVLNKTTIQLYPSELDLRVGLNTVGFSTTNTLGIHRFRTSNKRSILTGIKVLEGGTYENKELIIKPTGISTISDSIYFKNHNLKDKDLIKYTYQTTRISGINTNTLYSVTVIDEDNFKLSETGYQNPSENLLKYSEDFSNSYWTKNNVGITSMAAIAPDGTKTANLMTADTTNAGHQIARAGTYQNGKVYTASIFVKKNGSYKYVQFSGAGSQANVEGAIFDIESGIIYAPTTNVVYQDSEIEYFGDGWYRCSVVYKMVHVSDSFAFNIFNTITFGGNPFIGDNTGVYIWGVQVEEGNKISSTLSAYIKTTDSTRTRGIIESNSIDYNRKKYVNLRSTGSGYQYFKYPEINVSVSCVGFGTEVKNITSYPVVSGKITNCYVYESGSNYGSNILNLHKKPLVTIKTGEGAQLKPIIVNGIIEQVQIQFSGTNYYSTPELLVNGDGVNAKIKAVVSGGKIVSAVVINQGSGYTEKNTSISVIPSGKGAILDASIRSLSVNNNTRFGSEVIIAGEEDLKYSICSYNDSLREQFNDSDSSVHSPIIGWAYDGNPIYGAFGYSDPEDSNSSIKLISPSYTLNVNSVENRPLDFPSGFFIDDYIFDGSGDLDLNNGRYCRTPEFPDGVYAYFATLDNSGTSNVYIPKFPYFVGEKYRSEYISDNSSLNQDYDFNTSKLIRNTLPYKVGDSFARNEFLIQSGNVEKQKTVVEASSKGTIDGFNIIKGGDKYKVSDQVVLESNKITGSEVLARISSIKGKSVTSIASSVKSYNDAVFKWKDSDKVEIFILPNHDLKDKDNIIVSGFSTYLNKLNRSFNIEVDTQKAILTKNIPTNAVSGIVTDVFVSSIPNNISIGSSFSIGSEVLPILDIFPFQRALRTKRNISAVGYSTSTEVLYLPNSLTISASSESFESKPNIKVLFNPLECIGLGTVTGIASTTTYKFDSQSFERSLITRSIFLKNHPFETNQKVIFRRKSGTNALGVSTSSSGSIFSLPVSGDFQSLYIVNKSANYIGLKTSLSSDELFFRTNGSDDYEYSIESDFNQYLGNIARSLVIVSTAQTHGLSIDDQVKITVEPNLSVGIGTSSSVNLQLDKFSNKLLINPIGFSSSAINTSTSIITINNHGFKTGDKVYYYAKDVSASGLSSSTYFVYKIDSDRFNLSETLSDSLASPPNKVSIGSTGGKNQVLSLVNPQIDAIEGNDLIFNVSDSSLQGYNLGIYYDPNFKNKYQASLDKNSFIVSGVGTIGVTSTAYVSVAHTFGVPHNLYYTLEKSGISTSVDYEVTNYSTISFTPSLYNNTYKVKDVSSDKFALTTNIIPENVLYNTSNTTTLKYTTTSKVANGEINDIEIVATSSNFKDIPAVISIASTEGTGSYVVPTSKDIGKSNSLRIVNQLFEYSADKTIRPTAKIPKILTLESKDTIKSILIDDGGKNYSYPPKLRLINSETRELVEDAAINPILTSNTITSLDISYNPKGLKNVIHELYSIDNSNGISISKVESSTSGIVTCYLKTPINNFPSDLFSDGDKIFVEGIEIIDGSGNGLNSTDNGYNFFTVPVGGYTNSNPAILEYSISGFTTNPGIAKTSQTSFASVIKYSDYPKFTVNQENINFKQGEKLLVKLNQTFVSQDLNVVESKDTSIRVLGTYDLKNGDVIKGDITGVIATINSIKNRSGEFNVDYSNKNNSYWEDNSGYLNEDIQTLSDNDYYQNLSYTVKSPLEFEDLISNVNSLVHPVGLKNFADTEIKSVTNVPDVVGITTETIIRDIIDETLRVDDINNFDLGIDLNPQELSSKFIKLKNKRLASYIKCSTNKVLEIDDIGKLFSNNEVSDENTIISNIISYPFAESFNRFLIQTTSISTGDVQLTELVVLTDKLENVFSLEKNILSTSDEKLSDITAYITEKKEVGLKFEPTDPYDTDYNIKLLKNTFNQTAGIGSTSFGFANLLSNNQTVSGITTESVIEFPANIVQSLYANIEIFDETNIDSDFVDIYLTYNGNDTYLANYYFDSEKSTGNFSSNISGDFNAIVESGVLKLKYYNKLSNQVNIRSKVIGIGSTSSGIGTYRFKNIGELNGFEKTAKYESQYSIITGVTTVLSLNKETFSSYKSFTKVGVGSTSALYEVSVVNSNQNTSSTSYPFLTVEDNVGIGTFDTKYTGSNIDLVFYPDSKFTSSELIVQSFNEIFYTQYDFINIPPDLNYGSSVESIFATKFDSVNGDRINSTSFELFNKGFPIYAKKFDPSDSSVLNPVTGEFTIKNHFFSNYEKLIYKPGSTFSGISSVSVGIGLTLNSVGVVTNILPSDVYAIKIDNDKFKLSTRLDYANAGIFVTFTSYGSGNAHVLEMNKKLERTIISIDDVVQYPLSYTPISYNLVNNYGSIGSASTIISVSGISSLRPKDIFKLDDELLKINKIGIGTTNTGPISGIGTYLLLEVERGSLGSISSSHTDNTVGRIYRGSFNIVENNLHFIDPPLGQPNSNVDSVDESGLLFPRSSFNGRVFLRQDYSSNQLYDDLSGQFTGIGQTFRLTINGSNTTGIGTSGGNGIVFINNVFQTPTTENNLQNNFYITENNISGISSIVFTGITSENGSIITNNSDVNQNQLPRNGLIVSLGSTAGLGYAPLVGASVTAIVNSGVIISVGTGSSDVKGSGYYGNVSVAVTESGHTGTGAVITAQPGSGGELSFTVVSGGSGYVNPTINVSPPSYQNLPVTGVSRLGIGSTSLTGNGLLLNVNVGAKSTTGIGSTLFEVTSFNITRQGYGFNVGDVFTPVGLVTSKGLLSPLQRFELTVLDTFTDSFAAWQFGELDYIDSIKNLQDGVRTRFPLYYNSQLLSFEIDPNDQNASDIDLNYILLIFINGVLQQPGNSYQFDGGSTFIFNNPPKSEDNISIFFYRGSRNTDSTIVSVNETLKIGDGVRLTKNNTIPSTISQEKRIISSIESSDSIETDIYLGEGIDDQNYKPIVWSKQKVDKNINGTDVYKSRDSIESQIYPTARLISDFGSSSTQIFVDNAKFFNYENPAVVEFDSLIIDSTSYVSGLVTATVGSGGSITNLTINNAGSEYTGGSVTVKFASPNKIGIGIGTIAEATISIVGGSLSTPITITNPGYGYSLSNPPKVIIETPKPSYENILNITDVKGFSGIVTGIGTTAGVNGGTLAIKFNLDLTGVTNPEFLQNGYPIFVYDTLVGKGVTSIYTNNSNVVGFGTTFANNIYIIQQYTYNLSNNTGIITANINSTTNIVGLNTSGICGKFSWGRLSGFASRSNPISIGVTGRSVDVGLSTFPVIQRRGYGLRDTGAIKKQ